jgi:EAL domain-containing protein (putative c-di-GMP-specific phosphodiesterase class I)/GGDEF domain-containing protein
MKEDIAYKNIIEKIAVPVIVLEPQYHGRKIYDYKIIYLSSGLYPGVFGMMQQAKCLTQYRKLLPPEIDWFYCLSYAINKRVVISKDFFSQYAHRWFHIIFQAGADKLCVCSLQEITNYKVTERNLEFVKKNDLMTGFGNSSVFYTDFRRYIDDRNDLSYTALVLFEIDNIKTMYILRGQEEGSLIIKKFISCCRDVEAENVRFYRLGCGEFALIFCNAFSRENVECLIEKLYLKFISHHLSVSAGASVYPDNASDCPALLTYARLALDFVKKGGKGTYAFFRYEMFELYNRQTTLCNKINNAVTKNLFELYYQPQVEINSYKLRGFEALIRWHDSGKWMDPNDFIPVAEETRSIVYIGKWVMETALNTLKQWQTLYNFDGIMAINVSPVQLDDSDFVGYFTACIHKLGIDAGKIELEITEHTFFKDMDRASVTLSALRKMGVSLSLDDFGTGYSSFEYLEKLPFTTLKIDKSFTDEVCIKNKSVSTEIVPAVISAVSKRGITTIVEGVEKEAQLTELRKTECSCIQGFLVGKPMTYKHCLQYLRGTK